MKKILFILSLFAFCGCTSKTEQAKSNAQQFLDAFLNNDYKQAAELCDKELQEDLNKAFNEFKKLEDPMKRIIQEQCANMKAEITAFEKVGKGDTVIVHYDIVKNTPSASADSLEAKKSIISSTLRVVKDKIVRLN